MPLYEYRCTSCGKKFERIQKFSDPPIAACPDCGAAVEKLLSSPAFHLKGSGWYATDYAKAGQSKSDEGGKPPQDKSEKGEATEKSQKSETSEKTDKGESVPAATEAKPAADKPKAEAPRKSEGSPGSS